MKYSKKKIILSVLLLIVCCTLFPYKGISFSKMPEVHEGDVIFHTSKSSQSPLIAAATGSPLTHCGIIVIRKGEPYVLEASSTLKLTPLKAFIKRGKNGAYWIKHPKGVDGNVKIRYSHLLDRKYDLAFSFKNDKYYCSELVYDIYKHQLGITLCKPRQIKSYHIIGMKKVMRRRGIDPEAYAVAPSDLFESGKWK